MQAALVSRYYGDAPRTTMSLFMITAAALGTLGGWVATYYAPVSERRGRDAGDGEF